MGRSHGVIYKITHKAFLKSYVGQTTVGVENRFRGHCNAKSASVVSRAIAKHGQKSFELSVLYEAFDADALDQAEIELIAEFNSRVPNGYNVAAGGQFSPVHATLSKKKLARQTVAAYELLRSKILSLRQQKAEYNGVDDLLAHAVAKHLNIPRERIAGVGYP